MRSPLTLIAVALLLVANGRSSIASDDSTSATIAYFESLDRPSQQELVRRLLINRFEAAGRISLSADKLDQQRVRYREVLKRLAEDRKLSGQGYERLVQEVAAVERAAIDQLSLQFRVKVYGRFHSDRAEYDRRMGVWRNLLSIWESSADRIAEGPQVISWLAKTLDRMRYDESAVLPPLPRLDEVSEPLLAAPVQIVAPLEPNTAKTSKLPAIPQEPAVSATLPPPVAHKPNSAVAAVSRHSIQQGLPEPPTTHTVQKPVLPKASPAHEVAKLIAPPIVELPESHRPAPELEMPHIEDLEPGVRINLDELSVRIAGYNSAVRNIIGSLQSEEHWSPEQLTTAINELAELATKRAELLLYRELISDEHQQAAGELMPLDGPIALLGGKLFAAREQLTSAGASPEKSKELSVLKRLSQKLASIAGQHDN